MPVHLEITDGPAKGKKIPLSLGKTLSVGRSSAKSMLALPDDPHLSGQHFSVGLRNGKVFLCNLSKTNPTEMNGRQVDSAVLKPGENFKAGANVFSVIDADNPHQAPLRFGGWGFHAIPQGWEINEEKGLRHTEAAPFRANIILAEESLPKDYDLPKYVALQVSLGEKHLKQAKFEEPKPIEIKGADQALALTIQALAEKGPVLQFQIYAAHSGIVGILTATSLESQGPMLRATFKQVLPGLTFFQG